MKKILALLAVLILTVGLVACGDDEKEEETNTDTTEEAGEETDGEDEGEEKEDSAEDGDSERSGKLDELLTLLEDNGMEVNVTGEGNLDIVGSTASIIAEINGEDLFTFEAFELEEGHENIAQVEESGEATMDFDGMKGEVPAWNKGNFVFLLPEGHEDYDEIVELIENEFDVE